MEWLRRLMRLLRRLVRGSDRKSTLPPNRPDPSALSGLGFFDWHDFVTWLHQAPQVELDVVLTEAVSCYETDPAFSDLVPLLLMRGANPNIRMVNGFTPLTFACLNTTSRLVQCLLSYGADPNLQDDLGQFPLTVCGIAEKAETAVHLLQAGADPVLAAKFSGPGQRRLGKLAEYVDMLLSGRDHS